MRNWVASLLASLGMAISSIGDRLYVREPEPEPVEPWRIEHGAANCNWCREAAGHPLIQDDSDAYFDFKYGQPQENN